jgi:hypothetical protein
MGRLRRIVFGISHEEASFGRRGFRRRDERARARLERIGRTFLDGYHAALESEGGELPALLDTLTPWRGGRLKTFIGGAGAPHAYMVYVGAGWALARLRRDPARALKSLDPLLGWLALDGYGFHEGYFKWPAYVARRERPRGFGGYAQRAFDQGLGRSIWFVEGADVESVAAAVEGFESERQSDLWSGVGLACAYAGGVGAAGVERLRARAGRYAAHLAQGAAFAAKARQRACNPAGHTDDACRVLCGASADEAARVTDEALLRLPPEGDEPAYEVWRRRVAKEFAGRRVTGAEFAVEARGALEPVPALLRGGAKGGEVNA